MITKDEAWELIEGSAKEIGAELFDLELPSGTGGVLRIFITGTKPSGEKAGLDDCASLARLLLDHPQVEEFVPGESTLEVSTPGVNRRLKRPEHFEKAVGERVKLTFTPEATLKGSVRGELLKFSGEVLEVKDEQLKTVVQVPLKDVREARVDFLFK